MAYDDAAFRALVARRASELNKTITQVLSEAGVSHDAFYKRTPKARRIDVIERIAEVLGITLIEALGLEHYGRISSETLETAYRLASRINTRLPRDGNAQHRLLELTAHMYNILAARLAAGNPATAADEEAYVTTSIEIFAGRRRR
jgi:hypothetical protein